LTYEEGKKTESHPVGCGRINEGWLSGLFVVGISTHVKDVEGKDVDQ
jgi:hypothetical protein